MGPPIPRAAECGTVAAPLDCISRLLASDQPVCADVQVTQKQEEVMELRDIISVVVIIIAIVLLVVIVIRTRSYFCVCPNCSAKIHPRHRPQFHNTVVCPRCGAHWVTWQTPSNTKSTENASQPKERWGFRAAETIGKFIGVFIGLLIPLSIGCGLLGLIFDDDANTELRFWHGVQVGLLLDVWISWLWHDNIYKFLETLTQPPKTP